jgi:hypothetical protein
LDAIGCALLRVIGREAMDLLRFEGEDEFQPMNALGSDGVDDDDAVMIGPVLDKAFFSQLAANGRTITDTNWVPMRMKHLATGVLGCLMTALSGALHRQVLLVA